MKTGMLKQVVNWSMVTMPKGSKTYPSSNGSEHLIPKSCYLKRKNLLPLFF